MTQFGGPLCSGDFAKYSFYINGGVEKTFKRNSRQMSKLHEAD
jgi:bisphosphoglycerate-independent phosphoglycerate mutase (AlkP superfamily)